MFACKLSRHNTDRSYRKRKYTHGATMHSGDINLFEIAYLFKKVTNCRYCKREDERTGIICILTVERGWNINKINLGAIDKLTLLQN